ncbi:MAG: polyprenyl synthetase family protein [Bacteriovoracaceae bacterium]
MEQKILNHDFKLNDFFFPDDERISSYASTGCFDYFNYGKNLRAYLVFEFGKIFKISDENLYLVARGTELIHNATLTHDDVIDESFFRRSSETINKRLGNKKAILVGDYLLAKALHELSQLQSSEVIAELALCFKKMVDGEWFQMENQSPYQVRYEEYVNLAKLKTGALFGFSFVAPYLLYSKNKQNLQTLKEIGDLIGVIFQMKDDLKDFSLDLSKTPFLDFTNNNPNIVFSDLDQSFNEEQLNILLKESSFHNLPNEMKEVIHKRFIVVKNKKVDLKKDLEDKIDQFCKRHDDEQQREKLNKLFEQILNILTLKGQFYEKQFS